MTDIITASKIAAHSEKKMARILLVALLALVLLIIILTLLAKSRRREHFENIVAASIDASVHVFQPATFNVFVINLKRRVDRMNNFSAQYSKCDLSKIKEYTRIEGVDGRQLDVERYLSPGALDELYASETRGFRVKHNQLTRGAVGCYLSHLRVYKAITDLDQEYAIVFEDDVKLDHAHLYKRIRVAIARLPNDWDILLLGCWCHKCTPAPTYKRAHHFFLLHAYIIRRSAAFTILRHVEQTQIRQQIDSELSVLASAGTIRVLCLSPGLVNQDKSVNHTNIQSPLLVLPGTDPFDLEQKPGA